MRPGRVYTTDGARYRFGVFDFDAATLELRKEGRVIKVRPQSLRLLALLLNRTGEMVSREDIQRSVWGTETFVDFEQGVNHCIRDLRTALGDTAESPRYIQTLPRRGYRFIAPLSQDRVAATNVELVSSGGVTPVRHRPTLPSMVTVAALAGAVVWLVFASHTAGSRPAVTSPASRLLVQPFTTSQSDPTVGIGLANAIASRLGGQQSVIVQAAGSTTASGMAVADGVLTLTGEITSTSARAAIVIVRLADSVSGQTVWSDRYHVKGDELFSVEDVIAERVVDALNLQLAATEQDRLRRRYTNNTAAYREYLNGRAAVVEYTAEGTLRAIRSFESALQMDPRYALARAGLAMAAADMHLRYATGRDIEDWGKRAEAEARAALDIDPELAEAHLARAAVARKREFDWNATMTASRRALVLNPNLDQARFFMAAAYYHLGYMEEALIEMEKGRLLRGPDVVDPIRIDALVALFSANFVRARVRLEEVSRQSSKPVGDTYLALAYYYSGNVGRARQMLEPLTAATSASTASRSGAALAGILAAQRESKDARRQIDLVLGRDYRDHHVAYSLGAAYGQLGEIDEAARWLRTAADTGFACLIWFERDPLLEPVRQSAAFVKLRSYVQGRREASLPRAD